ncbi:glutaredoxin family protein [Polaribacter sp. HL-MS24]|uniref:glutaredoxin family protein n=1 Tax=Polaribacter sp. HL-MS24 TaxID=3077735 RepID=UPI00293460F6|nr:glutaredoxin domain-containing protein [Polaribacter sp. HL-MS24]WOC39844.1 glutaredoxin domain-containing protein [Polaribacter sp. HL-MS24]
MKICLYGKQGHAHTVAFKNFLRTGEIPFEYKDVLKDEAAKIHTKELYNGLVKIPTLFIDDLVYLQPTSDEFNKIMENLMLKG